MRNKTLLVVSGGIEAVPGIIQAKQMGLHVVVSDYNPHAPGFEFADEAIIASTYDPEETARAAGNYHQNIRPLNGVICVAADVPLTVATVAQRLGLPGIPVETALLASDKLAMKNHLAKEGIAVPWFSELQSEGQLRDVVKERGCSLIIKPVDSRGARGVLKLDRNTDLQWAYAEAQKYSPTGRVMIEEYIRGPQISTEAIVVNGKGYTYGFADRNYEFLERFAPYIIENGGEQPSALSEQDRDRVAQLAIQAGRSLGVYNGVVKGDMVLSPKGPMVIEIATRLSGGWFSTDQIPLHTGVDFVKLAIKIALGEGFTSEELEPRCKQGVAIRYFFPPSGTIECIPDLQKLQEQSGVHKVILFVKAGDRIADVTNHTTRAGCVITVGETGEEAVRRAKEIVSLAESQFVVKKDGF